jgi:ADP-ribose pyrophosphatase
MEYKTLSSQEIYHGRTFSVRIDQVQAPDGKKLSMEIVQHVGAVTILPVDNEGQVWFVSQYRHPTGKMLLELPAGMLNPGESPEICAAREVREEIGMAAGKLTKIGEFFLAPGYSSEYMHVFYATDLYAAPLPGDEDEYIKIRKFPRTKLRELVDNGEIKDAKSLAALHLAGL